VPPCQSDLSGPRILRIPPPFQIALIPYPPATQTSYQLDEAGVSVDETKPCSGRTRYSCPHQLIEGDYNDRIFLTPWRQSVVAQYGRLIDGARSVGTLLYNMSRENALLYGLMSPPSATCRRMGVASAHFLLVRCAPTKVAGRSSQTAFMRRGHPFGHIKAERAAGLARTIRNTARRFRQTVYAPPKFTRALLSRHAVMRHN